jgi:hypothetical protein
MELSEEEMAFKKKIEEANFDLMMIDECFTYETMIKTEKGEMMIGDIVENNIDVKILSFNYETKKTEYKQINRWISKSPKTGLVKITLNNGSTFICTPNHKIYVKDRGYVPAGKLTTNDKLYYLSNTTHKNSNNKKKNILFQELCDIKKECRQKTTKKSNRISEGLFGMQKNDVFYEPELYGQEGLLQQVMFNAVQEQDMSRTENKNERRVKKGKSFRNFEKYVQIKSTIGLEKFGTNESQQPNEESRNLGKNEEIITGPNLSCQRWEFSINEATNISVRTPWGRLDYGITNKNEDSKRVIRIASECLQSGFGKRGTENSDRSGWQNTQTEEMEIPRQKENRGIEFIGVESITLLERRGGLESRKLYDKNFRVYDLEIEDNHNYFANNTLVSNCHYISNPKAQRTKLINDIAEDSKRLWLLTGTPMTSRPINYYNLLKLIDAPIAQNWQLYVKRYCKGFRFKVNGRFIWNTRGASHLEELHEKTKPHLLRRLKTDVLDLPSKIITPVYLELKSKDYEELMEEYLDWSKLEGKEASLAVHITKLMNVRTLIAREKVRYTIEMVERLLEQEKKVIVFTNFTETLETIARHFGKAAVTLDGRMTKIKRQQSVDQFQEDPKKTVFVSNLKAGGVGITLTAAEAVIKNDLSFVPSDHGQAEDRAYRYGQKNSVSVYYPIFENTMERVIFDILMRKKNVIDQVMGDIEFDEGFTINLLDDLKGQ